MSTARTRSTFYWAMRFMPPARRAAMYAIYDLARALDDIADGAEAAAEKQAKLESWRREIDALYSGAPTQPLTQALLPTVRQFDLPRREFDELIAGLSMDVNGPIRAPGRAVLDLYCRRVAGSVGLLSLPVFGADGPAEQEFALHLGRALQLTNILRDLSPDAAIGRLYVPGELLIASGIDSTDPVQALRHPGFAAAANRLVEDARLAYISAEAALAGSNRRPLWPAVAMMAAYRALFDRLTRRSLPTDTPIRLDRWTALVAVLPAIARTRF